MAARQEQGAPEAKPAPDARMARLRAECDRQGRDPASIELTAYWNHHREGMAGFEVYAEHGVSRLLVNLGALRMGKPDEAMRRFADEVLADLPQVVA